MKKDYAFSQFVSPVMIIVFSAIALQLLGRYHANTFFSFNDFKILWIILRIIVPLIILSALKIPFSEIGLGAPVMDKKLKRFFLVFALVLVAVFAGIYFYQSYVGYYAGSFSSGFSGRIGRFINFMIFTVSTLTGWEFLHRGFLLMGLFYFLKEREKIKPETAAMLAVSIVWVFEVVFHFIKPQIEALGLLVGSPILSYITLRCRSIWPSFFIHLLVEILFIFVVIFQ